MTYYLSLARCNLQISKTTQNINSSYHMKPRYSTIVPLNLWNHYLKDPYLNHKLKCYPRRWQILPRNYGTTWTDTCSFYKVTTFLEPVTSFGENKSYLHFTCMKKSAKQVKRFSSASPKLLLFMHNIPYMLFEWNGKTKCLKQKYHC